MPDAVFADPRLARLYDEFDGPRDDLEHYLAIARELHAHTVLDVGCGTGCLALLLADEGLEVTGVDPALASLDVARAKPGADRVRWVHGTGASVPTLGADLTLMTGNVAQVFVDDEAWHGVLDDVGRVLRANGHLVFESRRPEHRVWEEWAAGPTDDVIETQVGVVRHTFAVTAVDLPLVSFRHSYGFADGSVLVSDSTIRFRTRAEIESSLTAAGFTTVEVRQAPDRPGREYVFIAQKRQTR